MRRNGRAQCRFCIISTPNEALRQYKTVLSRTGSSSTVNGSSSQEEKTATGKVVRVYKEQNGDFTNVSFLLDNGDNYIVSTEVAPLAVYLQEKDKVEVTYINSADVFLPVKELKVDSLLEKE